MAGFMIAACASGSGKTMLTCGLLEVFRRRGWNPWSFKCGPDYIDGLFHRTVLGVEGGNLDSFFETKEQMRQKYALASRDHLVVAEGVMGYYDGLGGILSQGSSWEIAQYLGLPVVLVIDARGASVSLSALIQGFLSYRPEGREENRGEKNSSKNSGIAAILLNHMSPMLYPRIKELVEREQGIPVIGYVPDLEFLKVGSRHLGLVLPEEIPGLKRQMKQLGDCLEKTVDIAFLKEIAKMKGREISHSPILDQAAENKTIENKKSIRLGVAWDEAFCFYYRDNLEILKKQGAELVYVSPLHEQKLPEELDGLLLGGGYPENYGPELSENESMRNSIKKAADQGMPMLGECGGYLYLLEELEGADGRCYPMAGVLRGKGYRKGKNGRFGYLFLSAVVKTPYLKQGEEIKGHEFHYWDCITGEEGQEAFCMRASKPVGERNWPCIRVTNRVLAGFPHLYYPSQPLFAERFVRQCMEFRKEQGR